MGILDALAQRYIAVIAAIAIILVAVDIILLGYEVLDLGMSIVLDLVIVGLITITLSFHYKSSSGDVLFYRLWGFIFLVIALAVFLWILGYSVISIAVALIGIAGLVIYASVAQQ